MQTTEEKWEKLLEADKLAYHKMAKSIGPKLLAVASEIDSYGCFKCKFKPKNLGELEFHLESTHGLKREIFEQILMSLI